MMLIVPQHIIPLQKEIKCGDYVLVGYSPLEKEAMLRYGSSYYSVNQLQRAAWDHNEEAFTEETLFFINQAIQPLVARAGLLSGK